jgi:hypothetical protein
LPSIVLPVRPEGLILGVVINHSKPKLEAMTKAGQALPTWETAEFLVDTGASLTMMCKSIAAKLALASHGLTPVHTASSAGTPAMCNSYDIAMYIPGMPGAAAGHFVEALPVTESDFTAHSFKGLLGRDVLQNCVLTYIGPSNEYVLSY